MAKQKVFCRAFGNYDMDEVSLETGVACEDRSLTVQSEKDDADINVIVKRFGITGTMPVGIRVPEFSDFADVFDFRSAVETVRSAEVEFMKVPAEVRARFSNDPQKWIDFVADPVNLDECVKLGFAVRKEVPPDTPKA